MRESLHFIVAANLCVSFMGKMIYLLVLWMVLSA